MTSTFALQGSGGQMIPSALFLSRQEESRCAEARRREADRGGR